MNLEMREMFAPRIVGTFIDKNNYLVRAATPDPSASLQYAFVNFELFRGI